MQYPATLRKHVHVHAFTDFTAGEPEVLESYFELIQGVTP